MYGRGCFEHSSAVSSEKNKVQIELDSSVLIEVESAFIALDFFRRQRRQYFNLDFIDHGNQCCTTACMPLSGAKHKEHRW